MVEVRELVADPIVAGISVLAGADGLARELVDVVTFEGHLDSAQDCLLLCGAEHVTPPYRLDALVRRAHEARVGALLVVAAQTEPLDSTRRLADRLDLPLLWLTQAAPVRLAQELTVLLRAPELLRGATVERLLRALSSKRTGAAILATAQGVLATELALTTVAGTPILGEPPATDEVHLDQPVAQRGAESLWHPVLDPDVNRLAAWLVAPRSGQASARLDTIALGMALTEPFLRSWLAAQRAQADRDEVFRAHVLSEIRTSRDAISPSVVEGALSLGWRLQDWHVGIAATATGPGQERVAAALAAGLAELEITVTPAVARPDGWSMWISTEREPGPAATRSLLRAVRQVSAAQPREWGVAVGLGRPHRGPGGLADSLDEARDALGLALSHEFRPAVEHADELGVARLLASWQRSEVTLAFAETALAPLRNSPTLLSTLRAYLEAGGSMVTTAQILGVHRNTVTARLQQVREQLGIDLDDPSQRLALQVACRSLGL